MKRRTTNFIVYDNDVEDSDGFVPERVGDLEVGTVSGDQKIAGVIDICEGGKMTEFESQVFEPGEPFIYRKAPGVYELGIVKRDRGDGTYACYYSTGDTAAVTPVFLMRKLVNAHWAPFRWSHIWGRHSIEVGELLDRLPGSQEVLITDGSDGRLFCRAVGVPEVFMGMQVIGITVNDDCLDIEVCDV